MDNPVPSSNKEALPPDPRSHPQENPASNSLFLGRSQVFKIVGYSKSPQCPNLNFCLFSRKRDLMNL